MLTACAPAPQRVAEQIPDLRHVPSPDWRDQVVYFLMIDRFADGDPSNNDQGVGEFDPTRNSHYSGGDLRGIQQRLDYVKNLGATTIWITPPVANRWRDAQSDYTGYHGYWAQNFVEVDRHYGSLADYQQLAERMHGAGLFLLQDIVVNHTGNYFSYPDQYDPHDPTRGFVRSEDAPTQAPFDLNDVRNPQHRAAAIYHYTPAIRDYSDPQQEANWQMADLDDLNTENPQVRAALRRSYNYWIREVGVDGFRVDTAFYVPAEYFEDFLYAKDPQDPGILETARSTGRAHFHVFGEGFAIDQPYSDQAARKIDRYMRAPDGTPRLPGMLNFPLYGSLNDVFARGRPTAELADRIEQMMRLHAQPHLMPSFIDNHDVDRFLSGGSEAALKQALLAMLTLPGIPTIYYGTEQGFREPRTAMFAGGFGAEGRDHFDQNAPLYRYLQKAIALRREHALFSRGVPEILHGNRAGAGALVYRMRYQDQQAIVVFNSAESTSLLTHLDTGLPPGTRLLPWFAIGELPAELRVDAAGQVTLVLPARSATVWGLSEVVDDGAASLSSARPDLRLLRLNGEAVVNQHPGAPVSVQTGDFEVAGVAQGVSELRVVVNGELQRARVARPDSMGQWRAQVDTKSMLDPDIEHEVVAYDPSSGALSARAVFRVQREWKLLAQVADPLGDDHGRNGQYVYPSDPVWREQRPLDIEQVRIFAAGTSLKVELRMHQIVATWSPPNGFDHVAFNVFLQLPCGDLPAANPEQCGISAMPLQNATLPQGMRWQYRIRAHGWTNALFSSIGASADNEGTPATPTASIQVDRSANTVSFVLPGDALGDLGSLAGVRVYISTWDYDGGFRALAAHPGPFTFGGGSPGDPFIMDESAVIELPTP